MDNAILENILRQVRPLIGQGKVADYIPALATVDGSRLGIAICTVDGQLFQAGDAQERFSIQSISKVLSLVVAMRHYSEEEIWQRVGKDPSGSPFNSLVQLEMEQGIPRNPFINTGALVVCDMLQGRLSAPRQRMLEVVRGLSGVSDISYDTVVARSEFEHSARNAAIAWLMKSFGNFHHDVTTVLQNYFHYCALKMSCVELARTFVFLANQGKAIHIDEPVVTPMQARQINALMATSGMYQNAGVFARYVWLNRLHYYAISYVAMLVYDAITTEWGLVSLVINFSNMMFIVTVALLVVRDKRLGKNKYEPVSALRLFNYCLIAALLCAIVGAIGSVSIDSLDFWPLLADWFSEQFSTGVLIVPCMLTLAIPGVLPRFKAEQMMPAIALIVSVIASVVIGGAGSLAFPLPALIWCAVRYTPQVTCLLTFVTGAVEIVLVANSVIDISVGSPFSIPEMFSARLGIATMAICPIMVSFSVAAINLLMKQVALRADFDFLTQVYSRSGLYEALKSPSLKQTQHLTVMLLDIDYFKSINDNYGHECGDKVLSVFARHIQKIVGDKGLVARMGGEEFAVAVPSVNPVDGLLMAEKIRKGVELQPFTWQQKTLYLTVSIGVGSGRASYRTLTDDFNKLMVEADTCLYRSKKDGRNRTSTMRYGEEVV
ncbi:glutaminase [Shigella flexneri]|nr:glutaminase [Shigella flexneri]EFX7135051.1 glutaminase [Shigella flexneri]EFY0483257.1 glutaminase [Shigella flexneri]EFY0937827.1 glutaminase [Shigella flexneri]EFZ3569705.1 glutaminase B [Shigella flexneri]